MKEKEDKELEGNEKEEKLAKFRENAEKQRKKIQDLKRTGGDEGEVEEEQQSVAAKEVVVERPASQPSRLTEENLRKNEVLSQKASSKPSKKSKAKPAWAMTEHDLEEQKEKEIDDLLEFAYELDYEKYMDDFEVRQALAIIKDRVKEIKQDSDWKTNMAKEWNEASGPSGDNVAVPKRAVDDDARSAITYNSSKTAASKKSLRSQVLEAIQEEGANKAQEWDRSTKGEQKTTEDRIAQRLANEVLRDNAKLRGIHSASSIKKLLEKEAKKQLLQEYKGPIVSVIKEREAKDEIDPSYLPYLHKNPAI